MIALLENVARSRGDDKSNYKNITYSYNDISN